MKSILIFLSVLIVFLLEFAHSDKATATESTLATKKGYGYCDYYDDYYCDDHCDDHCGWKK